MFNFPVVSRQSRYARFVLASLAVFGAVCAFPFEQSAKSEGIYRPLDLVSDETTVAPGDSLHCTVHLTGGPAQITVYSNPPGVVSYQGTVNSATSEITLPVSAQAASGIVTLNLVTTGETLVSTQVDCVPNTGGDVPGL